MLRKFLFLVLICFSWNVKAQNTPVSQYYASPLLLNPGLTGTIPEFRAAMIYRGQAGQGGFGNLSNLFAVDYNIPDNGISVGLMVDQLVQTNINQRSTHLSGLVSYEIIVSDAWRVRPGIKLSYGRRDINFISNSYYIPYSPSQSLNADNTTYLSADAGAIVYNDNFWFGASFYNLNEPNISIFSDNREQLLLSANFQTGYRFPLNETTNEYLSLAVNFKENNDLWFVYNNTQLDLGVYYTSGMAQLGAWYRGINTKGSTSVNYTVPHDMLLMAAINLSVLHFGYSYEFRVRGTGLSNFHELSLAYKFGSKENYSPHTLPLPWL